MPKLYPLPGPVARSLEVVGDRWTLLVVRELLLGGRRWAELERALTDKGRDLAPVLASLAAWGMRHCGEPSSALATHAGCGGRVLMKSSCSRCGATVRPESLDVRGLR